MKLNGANGMYPGDRVYYSLENISGTAKEFLQDGEAEVEFDNGVTKLVKWIYLRKLI